MVSVVICVYNVYVYYVYLLAEISAKYMETSAKTGYNIGESEHVFSRGYYGG